eukprot:7212327-Prymnesium_polylepis.1
MQSGLGDSVNPGPDIDTIRMIVSVMTVLMEEASQIGAKFAKSCGRETVTGRDIVAAMKYEAHFWGDKDFDERVLQRFQEERTHTYATDDESSEEEVDDDEANDDKADDDEADDDEADDDEAATEESYTDTLIDEKEAEFHANVLR